MPTADAMSHSPEVGASARAKVECRGARIALNPPTTNDVLPNLKQWKSVKWEGIRDVILMSGEATAGSGIPLIKFGIRGGAGMTIDNRVERWR